MPNNDSQSTTIHNSVQDQLAEYRQRGLNIIPFRSGAKVPATEWRDFQTTRVTDAQIAQWMDEHPDCNWGVVTGPVSGVVVIDADSAEAIAAIEALGVPADCPRVKTPNAGMHFYFAYPERERIGTSASVLMPDVDVRGVGGLAVLPPSKIGDRPYEWASPFASNPIPQLPSWVTELLAASEQEVEETYVHERPANAAAHAASAAVQESLRVIETRPGARNDQLNRSAFALGTLVATGTLRRDVADAALTIAGLASGLPYEEVANTIASGLEGGTQRPRWPSRFKLTGLQELRARPRPLPLIDGVLNQRAYATLNGAPGLGKSLLALDLGLCIATGKTWAGRAVTQGEVVYVAAEAAYTIEPRVAAWETATGTMVSDVPFRVIEEPTYLASQDVTNELVHSMRGQGFEEPRLIIVDTLAACFEGDENSAKDLGAFNRGAQRIMASFSDCSVLVVHHHGKDTSKGARGSTVLRGSLDTELTLTSKDGRLTLQCTKQRNGEPFPKMSLRVRNVDLGRGRASAVVEVGSGTSVSETVTVLQPAYTDNQTKALEALRSAGDAGLRHNEWEERADIGASNFRNARIRLGQDNLVRRDAEGRYTVVNDTPPELTIE